jgi:hypothetical protein
MAGQRITLQLEGSPTDEGHLRLGELIKQLELVRSALKQTERIVTKTEDRLLYYKVVDLSHSSPLTCVLEATPVKPEIKPQIATRTVTAFFRNIRQIGRRGRVPSNVDLPALEAYRDLGSLLEKNISGFKIINSNFSVEIDERFKSRVTEIIGPDELAEGSLTGMLEWLNIHNTNVFHVYPVIGPKKVNCVFPQKLRETVISAIDRHVRVFGELRYKRRDNFPYAMNVSDIEILPTDDELPTLYDLRGIAPHATGDMNSVEFVRSIRDASW